MMFFFDTNPYIAVIGDIVGSRAISDRNGIQRKLNGCLNAINELHAGAIASRFVITLGDEFQGLLCAGSKVIGIIEYIERKMYPTKLRFGIGVGGITTQIDPEMALGADGPAYYRARSMIDCLKEKESRKMASESSIMISADPSNCTDILFNEIFSLSTVIKNKWTARQREIIHGLMENGGKQITLAERLGITQSSVQKSLAASGYYTYRNAMDAVSSVLSQIDGAQKE